MADQAARIPGRVQLMTDRIIGYPAAVGRSFGPLADYAVLIKKYEGGMPEVEAKRRYSPPPAAVIGATKHGVAGAPAPATTLTSLVKPANLTIRMGMRRFTRLTNAFSKKWEDRMHAVSFYFMVYNFVKVNGSVKNTPAIAAGVTTIQWTKEDIVAMTGTTP